VLSFGPVIERMLQINTECFLDLDTGQTRGPAIIGRDSDLPQSMDLWIPHVQEEGSIRVGGVFSLDHLIVLPATSADWDMAPEDLGKRMKPLGPRVIGGSTSARELANRLSELPRTHLFRTPEGNEGVLQILAFTRNHAGVKIRYKLVRPATSELVEQSSFISGAARGVETVLHHAFTADELFDLDHGKRLGLPPDSDQWDRMRVMQWLASSGVELAVIDYEDDASSGWGLATRRGLCRIDDLRWDTLEATMVQNALTSGRPGLEQIDTDGNGFSIYRLPVGLPPISFALTTSEGRLAAFQITGFTENPRGVKIRYKLVGPTTAATSFGEKPLPIASKVPPGVVQTIPESD
jgi:hypothetical protein